jgi:putative ABC transport system permease protein
MAAFGDVAGLAVGALRQHPLRSLLSTLGLVIGVAALVGILALADGMERFAREQIGTTTNFQVISIVPSTSERVDGVTLRRDSAARLDLRDAAALQQTLGTRATVTLTQQRPAEVRFDTIRTAAALIAADAGIWALGGVEIQEGRLFTREDVAARNAMVVISAALAERLGGTGVVGRGIAISGVEAEVIGVVSGPTPRPAEAYGPFPTFVRDAERYPPRMLARVGKAEDVPPIVREIETWLETAVGGGTSSFSIVTDELRTEQIRRGMLLFKLVMGLITGISVLVGGIGVMNVLLITVTERTHEIGIRKSVGARRRDILFQFLAEAMAVAGAGSLIGLLLGWAGIFTVAPIVGRVVDAPFHPAMTWQTVVVVGAVAVAVGLLFGTYPALRASRLRPVDALRYE